MNEKILVLTVFILVYAYLILFKRRRALAIWIGIAVVVTAGVINPAQAVTKVHWNVIGIFAGTLVVAEFFTRSRVPAFLADYLVGRSKSVGSAMLRVCIMSGLLSIFIENVAVVLIIAPIALEMVKKLNASPVPVIIGIAVASNLQGTVTLIGDPPSMILAGHLSMNFNDFFLYHGKPGLFFAVELSAVASFVVLFAFFRKFVQPVNAPGGEKVLSWTPTILLALMVVGLALAPLGDPGFKWLSGTICMAAAAASLVWGLVRMGMRETGALLKRYVFVLVFAFKEVGLIDAMTELLIGILGENLLLNFIFIIIFSVTFSAFIDNVPYITVMIPVVYEMGRSFLGSEYLLVFGLLIGTCMGGNITPVGAAANIVSVGVLRKEGYPISFWTFIRIGLPYTIAATAAGALFIWFVWK